MFRLCKNLRTPVFVIALVLPLLIVRVTTNCQAADTGTVGPYTDKKPSTEELQKIVQDHAKWLKKYKDHYESDEALKDKRRADLRGADLSEASLCNANLRGADLSEASLCNANLYGANLSGAALWASDLISANMSGADLSGADLRGAVLWGANLKYIDLSGADLTGADLSSAVLMRADLSGILLRRADLAGADLTGANLTKADLSFAELRSVNLGGADMRGADMWGADLFCCTDLSKADLSGAELSGTDLSLANLTGAKLSKAGLSGADISLADLTGANLSESLLWCARLNKANLEGADLSNAKLCGADLSQTILWGADLTNAEVRSTDLNGAMFEPNKPPECNNIAFAKNLEKMKYKKTPQELKKLRNMFKEEGFYEQERKITYAINHCETMMALQSGQYDPAALESVFKYLFFDFTTQWGMAPWRALLLLVCMIFIFMIPYAIAIRRRSENENCIYRKNADDCILSDRTPGEVEPLCERCWRDAVCFGGYFSVLSALSINWHGLDMDTWIQRIQAKEYSLRATGWVRTVSGVQAIISVYLFAIWLLTYSSRPFE